MSGDEKNLKNYAKKRSRKRTILAFLICVSICLSFSCAAYDPSLYPSYDVLNPGPEVKLNPIRVTEDGNFVVNEAFLMWVGELKNEIKKLRRQL